MQEAKEELAPTPMSLNRLENGIYVMSKPLACPCGKVGGQIKVEGSKDCKCLTCVGDDLNHCLLHSAVSCCNDTVKTGSHCYCCCLCCLPNLFGSIVVKDEGNMFTTGCLFTDCAEYEKVDS